MFGAGAPAAADRRVLAAIAPRASLSRLSSRPATDARFDRRGRRARHAEVDDLRDRAAVQAHHEQVRRLQVAVDDPLLMRVLDPVADREEELEALPCREPVLVAVRGDRIPGYELHHEERQPFVGRTRVEDLGDVRVRHARQGLALGFESGDHLGAVHPGLDDLQSHPARNDAIGNWDLMTGAAGLEVDRLSEMAHSRDQSPVRKESSVPWCGPVALDAGERLSLRCKTDVGVALSMLWQAVGLEYPVQ